MKLGRHLCAGDELFRQLERCQERNDTVSTERADQIFHRQNGGWRGRGDHEAVVTIAPSGEFQTSSRFGTRRCRRVLTATGGPTGTLHCGCFHCGRSAVSVELLRTDKAQRSVGADATWSNSTSDHRQEHQPPRNGDSRQLSSTGHGLISSRQIGQRIRYLVSEDYASIVTKVGKIWSQTNIFPTAGWKRSHAVRLWQEDSARSSAACDDSLAGKL